MDLSQIMANVAALLGGVAAVFATLCWVVFMAASGANSTPQQLRRIKRAMLAGLVVGLAFTTGSIWLWATGHPWYAVGVGVTPGVILVLLMIAVALR